MRLFAHIVAPCVRTQLPRTLAQLSTHPSLCAPFSEDGSPVRVLAVLERQVCTARPRGHRTLRTPQHTTLTHAHATLLRYKDTLNTTLPKSLAGHDLDDVFMGSSTAGKRKRGEEEVEGKEPSSKQLKPSGDAGDQDNVTSEWYYGWAQLEPLLEDYIKALNSEVGQRKRSGCSFVLALTHLRCCPHSLALCCPNTHRCRSVWLCWMWAAATLIFCST